MATFQATTASNGPTLLNSKSVKEVESIINEYDFVGSFDTLTVEVRESNDESAPSLVIHGYASFEASKPIAEPDGTVVDRAYGYTEEFLERIAPHLKEQLVVETVGFEKCRFPLVAGQWTVFPGGPVVYDSFDHFPDPPATGEPTYTRVAPICPICGHGQFVSSKENVPSGFDSHYISATCGLCQTVLTIEYRAIDISWYDGQDEHHSGVSQGRISPTDTGYSQPESYPPLPDADVLDRVNWPLDCEVCDERLSGNNMLTELRTGDSALPTSEDSGGISLRCPHCDHVTRAGEPADGPPA